MVKSPYPHRNYLRQLKQAQGLRCKEPLPPPAIDRRQLSIVLGKLELNLTAGNKAQALATLLAAIRDCNEQEAESLMATSLHALGLPVHTVEICEAAGIATVGDTLNHSDRELLAVPLLGRWKLDELRKTVDSWVRQQAAAQNRV